MNLSKAVGKHPSMWLEYSGYSGVARRTSDSPNINYLRVYTSQQVVIVEKIKTVRRSIIYYRNSHVLTVTMNFKAEIGTVNRISTNIRKTSFNHSS